MPALTTRSTSSGVNPAWPSILSIAVVVRDDDAVEAELALEHVVDQVLVGVHLHAVPAAVGDHHRADAACTAALNGGRWIARSSASLMLRVALVLAAGGAAVADVVLGGGQHRARRRSDRPCRPLMIVRHRPWRAAAPRRTTRTCGPSGRCAPRTGTARSPSRCRCRTPPRPSRGRSSAPAPGRGSRRARCCAGRSSRRRRRCGRAPRRRRRSAGSPAARPARRAGSRRTCRPRSPACSASAATTATGQQRAEPVRRQVGRDPSRRAARPGSSGRASRPASSGAIRSLTRTFTGNHEFWCAGTPPLACCAGEAGASDGTASTNEPVSRPIRAGRSFRAGIGRIPSVSAVLHRA